MASFGATGWNTTRARCGMVSQAIIILSYSARRRAVQRRPSLDAVLARSTKLSQAQLPPLTPLAHYHPMMNFTLAIWQLPFPCFCRKQYFEIASFPPSLL